MTVPTILSSTKGNSSPYRAIIAGECQLKTPLHEQERPMSKRMTMAAVAALAGLLAFAPAAEAKTFRYAAQGDFLGLDPHINNHGPTNAMKGNIYEGLVYRTSELKIEPALATEWKAIDATTWRFTLRQGVTFHNGEKFTADDVIFSWKRNAQAQSEMSFTTASVADVKKIDDFTIEIVTKSPNPILMQELPSFFIMSKDWTEKNGAVDIVGAELDHEVVIVVCPASLPVNTMV
jgi:peptide/nickel transport system substrate-binding protein